MAKHLITEFDIIFLSYDEPNAEKNWADLLLKAPQAKRVHGIKGFDAAHKACAKKSETERFITVDGDNIVHPNFFNHYIDIPTNETQIAWSGVNSLNGLIYGNGGLKLWSREFVQNMRTHENSSSGRAKTDFCWEDNYLHSDEIWSTTEIATTPFQAFKAGFREGVKMSLLNGRKVKNNDFIDILPKGNLRRLQIWCSVGLHHRNGKWAIYGSRLGCSMVNFSEWDYSLISNYDWFNDFWLKEIKDLSNKNLKSSIVTLGKEIELFLRLNIVNLKEADSRFFLETNLR